MTTRKDCLTCRAKAWLDYVRAGRADLVPPSQAAEALRIAVANAGFTADEFGISEIELWMYVFNYHQGQALRCLTRLRLGVGETEKAIADLRSHLAKAKLAPGDEGLSLSDIGTDEDEIAFFRTSDPLQPE
jgi:hypothetical protein